MVILDVGLEMLGEAVDALRENRHLHSGRRGIAGLGRVGLDGCGLAAGRYRHRVVLVLSGVTVGGRAGMSSSAVPTSSVRGPRPRDGGNIAKRRPTPAEIVAAAGGRKEPPRGGKGGGERHP